MSNIQVIATSHAPKAVGPYSQAIALESGSSSKMLFVSGQLPIDPKTGEMQRELAAATHQVLGNIAAILAAAGSDFSKVVRVEIFLQNMQDFPVVNEIYKGYFSADHFPARQTVEVAKLPLEALIEISCIAFV